MKSKKGIWLAALCLPAAAQAAEVSSQGLPRLYNGNEMVGIKPALGVNTYNDSQGGRSSRMSYGFAGEANLANAFGMDFTRWFIGPQTGLTYSHLGNSDANWFGKSSDVNTGEGGANMAIIPANIKAAGSISPALRIGAHGGGNVIYRSVPTAVNLNDGTDLKWRLAPNVGGDVDISLSKGVGLSLRPDWTLSNGSIFSATAALGISLG